MNSTLELAVDLRFAEEPLATPPTSWSWQLRFSLIGCLVLATTIIGLVAANPALEKSATEDLIGFKGLNPTVTNSLQQNYSDADGDLIADPPHQVTQTLLPETLVLAHYPGDDEGILRVDWESLRSEISHATGLPVKLEAYLHTDQEKEAVRSADIQIVAAHADEIPSLVNEAGLVSFAELGSPKRTDANWVVKAVKPNRPAESLEDLKGNVLVCTQPDSVTGYRAAIVGIGLEAGLRPKLDYDIYFSHKHVRWLFPSYSNQEPVSCDY